MWKCANKTHPVVGKPQNVAHLLPRLWCQEHEVGNTKRSQSRQDTHTHTKKIVWYKRLASGLWVFSVTSHTALWHSSMCEFYTWLAFVKQKEKSPTSTDSFECHCTPLPPAQNRQGPCRREGDTSVWPSGTAAQQVVRANQARAAAVRSADVQTVRSTLCPSVVPSVDLCFNLSQLRGGGRVSVEPFGGNSQI